MILENLPNIIQLSSPIIVVGDIHGQFYDLLNIFQKSGSIQNTQYLFLGDYVDRGYFCIEIITLLLAMKIKYPKNIHLLRGNHQSRALTSIFNFRTQCLLKYDQQIYSEFIDLFDRLPIGAIVDGKYFCVHAGISPEFKYIKQIQKINRFKQPTNKNGLCDLLWSDPIQQFSQKWKNNTSRNCSYYYGYNHSKTFLQNNKLRLIIRGHQVEKQGYKYQRTPDKKALTLTIFSAPNYCDSYRNKGSILFIEKQKLNIYTYTEVQHPLTFHNYMNVLQWSIPILGEQITKIFLQLLTFENNCLEKRLKASSIMTDQNQFLKQIKAIQKICQIQAEFLKQTKKNKEQSFNQQIKAQFTQMKQNDQGQKLPQQFLTQRKTQIQLIDFDQEQEQEQEEQEQDEQQNILNIQQKQNKQCVEKEQKIEQIIKTSKQSNKENCPIGPNLHKTFTKQRINTMMSFYDSDDDDDLQFDDMDIQQQCQEVCTFRTLKISMRYL